MLENFLKLILMLKEGVVGLADTDFEEIYYTDFYTSIVVGAIFLTLLLFKVVWQRFKGRRDSQKQSGNIPNSHKGLIVKSLNSVLLLAVSSAIIVMLLALAEPFLNQTGEITEVVESRIRIDIRDISSSMAAYFLQTEVSKGQVAAESHLSFLRMRQGKKDRTSFWLFASRPHKVEDFIVDDELYYQQVEDTGWLTGYEIDHINYITDNLPNYYIPKEKYIFFEDDNGGTDMVSLLQAVIRQFDQDERELIISGTDTSNMSRSILIITDAEVVKMPSDELEELRERKIVPYIIWIKSTDNPTAVVPAFARQVDQYGGKYFDITNQDSLERAYQEIDRFQPLQIKNVRKTFRVPLFQDYLLVAVLILVISIPLIIITAPFDDYP
jgi:hypothetical protein